MAQKTYQITAKAGEHLFYPGAEKSKLWLYNQSSPGPQISAAKGELLEVTFVNQLDQPTTVHWHGVRNINAMDGVLGLTQDAVAPGDGLITASLCVMQAPSGIMRTIMHGNKLPKASMDR